MEELSVSYLFPLLVSNNRRAVILDADSLLAVENSLKSLDDSQAKAVQSMLFEQGRTQGHRVTEDLSRTLFQMKNKLST